MGKETSREYKFWNGKNTDGKSAAGSPDLIDEGPRTGKTQAKYVVGNESVAADNLQQKPK